MANRDNKVEAIESSLAAQLGHQNFGTILADPPWRFMNRTGKVAPEHGRLSRYTTLSAEDIAGLPIIGLRAERNGEVS